MLLYESKGKRAECERDILLDVLEVTKNGKGVDRKSRAVGEVSNSSWVRQKNGIQDNIGFMGLGRSDRDVRVLQGQSKRNPRGAFKNVRNNLLEIQREDRLDSGMGRRGNGRIKYALSTYDTDAEELTPDRKKQIFEQFDKDRVGVDKPTQKQLWGERAAWVAHNMTRVIVGAVPGIAHFAERFGNGIGMRFMKCEKTGMSQGKMST